MVTLSGDVVGVMVKTMAMLIGDRKVIALGLGPLTDKIMGMVLDILTIAIVLEVNVLLETKNSGLTAASNDPGIKMTVAL